MRYLAGSYWFVRDVLANQWKPPEILQNGLVPNAVLVDDATIQSQVQAFLDYVLDHQSSDGWLGPEANDTSKPRYLWGRSLNSLLFLNGLSDKLATRYPFLFGAIQMMENDPSLSDRVIPALYKFVTLANTMLHNGEGLEDWAKTRWEDFVIALQWLITC